MALFHPGTLALIVLAALGYSVATIGMKMGSASLGVAAIALMALGFLLAAAAEVVILKGLDLGVAFIAIIGIETIIVLSYAWWIGEGLSLRQLGGAGMVIAGLAIVGH